MATKVILFFMFVVILSSCKKAGKVGEGQNMTVNVTNVKFDHHAGKKEFSFMAKPFRSSELSFRVGGPIDRFEVYAGNFYKRGSIIAEIDPRDFHIRKERTEAVYKQVKAEFERIKALYEKTIFLPVLLKKRVPTMFRLRRLMNRLSTS